MKKIAICIPTYNEEDIIAQTVKKIDNALCDFHDYVCHIVNSDSASLDNTCSVFNMTKTYHKKIQIKSKIKGKGEALINFFRFCVKEQVDYAVTLDADVISMDKTWVTAFLNKLIYEKIDFVTPIYARSRFEGSTTNQFAFPVVYTLTGKCIRQPIGGDFAFNKSYIDFINKCNFDNNSKKYGIDIFMTLMASIGGFSVSSVNLGEKIHKPSFTKMHDMFIEVCGACTKIIGTNADVLMNSHMLKKEEIIFPKTSILTNKSFVHKDQAEMFRMQCLSELKKYESIDAFGEGMTREINQGFISQTAWVDAVTLYIICALKNNISIEFEKIFSYIFVVRAISYWREVENLSEIDAESLLFAQAKEIRKKICKYLADQNNKNFNN